VADGAAARRPAADLLGADGLGAVFFLLALPAGALGDIFDRRKLILRADVWRLTIATPLAALTVLHRISPWMLLLLTLEVSIGDALETPSWWAGQIAGCQMRSPWERVAVDYPRLSAN
jgi:MFS family permease